MMVAAGNRETGSVKMTGAAGQVTVPSGRGVIRPAADFGVRRQRISTRCGRPSPPPLQASTARRNHYPGVSVRVPGDERGDRAG